MARSRASANYEISAIDRTRAGVQSARAGFSSLDSLVGKLGINFSLMGLAGSAAPGLIIAAQAPLIDQMGKLSTQTGVSVEFIQAYRREAALAGIESSTFDKAIEKMSRRVAEAAAGLGEARGSLDELGLSAVELSQLNPEDQFYAISKALEGVAKEGDKARLVAKIFDDEAVSLIRTSADAIRQTKEEMINLNFALSGADTKGVEAMNDQMFLFKDSASQASKVFTAEMAPAITGLLRQLGGSVDSMDGFRSVTESVADSMVVVAGVAGNLAEGLDNVWEGAKIGLTYFELLDAKLGRVFNNTAGQAELIQALEEDLQSLQDSLAGQTGDATFWTQLEAEVASARAEAAAAAADADENRKKFAAGIDVTLGSGESNTKSAGSGPNDSAFQSLLDSLATGTDKIEREYAKRLGVIDSFSQDFPARANEALQAQIAAEEARNKALDDYEQQVQASADQARNATFAPLESNLDLVRQQFQTENDVIIEEYENRRALLEELAVIDLDRRSEINDLLVQLAQDKEDRIAQIEANAVSQRVQIQSDYAAQALGVAANLVDSLAGEGEKGKRIAARISQAEALVAGISAAERARNHASLTGGLISGGLAAGLSWASTLANVAGIEAALNGSAPGGVSTSSGVSAGSSGDIGSNLSAGGESMQTINVTFVFDDEVIDKDAVKRVAVKGIAEATQSRDLTYNDSRRYYEENSEAIA